jgi:hypothetical protein
MISLIYGIFSKVKYMESRRVFTRGGDGKKWGQVGQNMQSCNYVMMNKSKSLMYTLFTIRNNNYFAETVDFRSFLQENGNYEWG